MPGAPKETWKNIDKYVFFSADYLMSLSQPLVRCRKNSFPYYMKIEINYYNWNQLQRKKAGTSTKIQLRKLKGWGLNFKVTQKDELSENFQIVTQDDNYKICRTYPKKLIFPRQLSLKQILACSRFRTKYRLPALSYYHKESGYSIWRSSQCMQGLMNNRSMEYEIMVQEIGKTANV